MKKERFTYLFLVSIIAICCKGKSSNQPVVSAQKEEVQHKGLEFPYIGKTKPEDFHVTAKCNHFERTDSGLQVKLIVSNPDTINYPAIYISVIGINKKGATEKITKLILTNVKAKSTVINTVQFPAKVSTVECPITGYD
ncbi:MAG: hypothetical protein JST86_16395 [Bacteroidetes bacterium]|nr:hypothetical protein [Bacteroidota bacterium]